MAVVHRDEALSIELVYGRPVDDLQERIAARLVAAVAAQERGGFERPGGQLALVDEDGVPRLSVDDVARIAAETVRVAT